jgi:transmembrane sensor
MPGRRVAPVAVLVTAVVLALCGAGGMAAWMVNQGRAQSYASAVGEQKRIALSDGSTMILDTDTTAEVRMKARSRQVAVIRGRVHFDVAKDNSRPFAVRFGDRQVVAVGTAFDVARYGDRASVVMTSGKVLLETAGARRLITRGERVSFDRNSLVQDQPDLNTLTAWQSGRALFDNQPLEDVVREMNRYSRRPIVLASADLGEMRVSGAYATSDLEGFAVSVATLLPLSVQTLPDRLVLARRR